MKLNSRCPKSLRWFAAAVVLPVLLLVASAFAANPIPQVVGPPKPGAQVRVRSLDANLGTPDATAFP